MAGFCSGRAHTVRPYGVRRQDTPGASGTPPPTAEASRLCHSKRSEESVPPSPAGGRMRTAECRPYRRVILSEAKNPYPCPLWARDLGEVCVGTSLACPVRRRRTICRRQIQRRCGNRKQNEKRYAAGSAADASDCLLRKPDEHGSSLQWKRKAAASGGRQSAVPTGGRTVCAPAAPVRQISKIFVLSPLTS